MTRARVPIPDDLLRSNLTHEEVARRAGCSDYAVRSRRRELAGLPMHKRDPQPPTADPDPALDRCGRPIPTHCRNGHLYTPATTRIRANGSRHCLVCQRDQYQRSRNRTAPLPPLLSAVDPPPVPWMPLCPTCLGFGFRQVGAGAWTRCQAADCDHGYRWGLVR